MKKIACANDLVSDKMREYMYLKHLRQVEGIVNRVTSNETLRQYKSISEMHKKNKFNNRLWLNDQYNKNMALRNEKIYKKIDTLRKCIRKPHNSLLEDPKPAYKIDYIYRLYTKVNPYYKYENKKEKNKSPKYTLHFRYRQKVQYRIKIYNYILMKSILSQKSAFFPYIKRAKSMMRSMNDKSVIE